MVTVFGLLMAFLAIGLVVRRYTLWARLGLAVVVAFVVIHVCFQ
ncbi:MAG TPA: hypothetical protein VFU88_11635 [Ktedonobacterales bacterium]|nr:hypothetical protein [Ktedonobacterales bacterium]